MQCRPLRSQTAFTLIELLVVLGIIGILSSLIVAGMGGAQRSGQIAQSVSNLRTIGAAVSLYGADNDTRLPVWYANETRSYWWKTLLPYVDGNTNVYRSPGDRNFDDSTDDKLSETVSYGWNYWVVGRQTGEAGRADTQFRYSQFPSPSETLVVAEGRTEYSYGFITSYEPPDPIRYEGRIPSLFLDGHVDVKPHTVFQREDPYFIPTEN